MQSVAITYQLAIISGNTRPTNAVQLDETRVCVSGVAVNRLRFHLYRGERTQNLFCNTTIQSEFVAILPSPHSFLPSFSAVFFFFFFFFSNFYSNSHPLLQVSAVNFLGAGIKPTEGTFLIIRNTRPGVRMKFLPGELLN